LIARRGEARRRQTVAHIAGVWRPGDVADRRLLGGVEDFGKIVRAAGLAAPSAWSRWAAAWARAGSAALSTSERIRGRFDGHQFLSCAPAPSQTIGDGP